MSFLIIKENANNIWKHADSTDPSKDLILSQGYFKIVGNRFELYSESGGRVRVAKLSDILIIDATVSNNEESYTSAIELITRLKNMSYPYF